MFVAEISASKLKTLVQRLNIAEPRKVAGLIAGIEKESTVLSQAVQKLSGHIDAIREQEEDGTADVPPNNDPRLLEVAGLLHGAGHGFVCGQCGGVHSRFELDEAPAGQTDDLRAKQRARQRAHEARR